jgi:CoA:oxalate CoA-transferase
MATNRTDAAKALNGFRVLDFSIMLAGPYCARLLADMGADVIKIETPDGDDMRQRTPLRNGHSSYFGQLNAGKRSMALDLKCSAAIDICRKLAAEADVLVENFRPGVMARLGLGYNELSAVNPKLVYCSISGYGQMGARAERAAYAMIVQAESGYDRTLARYAGDRDRPAPNAVFVADLLGGLNGYAAIQTALVQRGRTGLGQHVDVALHDGMANLLVYELQEAQFPVTAPRPVYGPVRAADGDVLIAPITAKNFEQLCDVTQLRNLREDKRFATIGARGANWTAMMQVVETWTRQHTVAACLSLLDAAGVPCARYGTPAEQLADPHLQARGLFARVSDGAGEFVGVNPPWQMSGSSAELGSRVPAIGEHTAAILESYLGIQAHDYERMAALGAFGRGRS